MAADVMDDTKAGDGRAASIRFDADGLTMKPNVRERE